MLHDREVALQLSAAAPAALDEMMIVGEHAHVRLPVEDTLPVVRILGTTEDAHLVVKGMIRTQGRRGFEIDLHCRLESRHLHAAVACDLLRAQADTMTTAPAFKAPIAAILPLAKLVSTVVAALPLGGIDLSHIPRTHGDVDPPHQRGQHMHLTMLRVANQLPPPAAPPRPLFILVELLSSLKIDLLEK